MFKRIPSILNAEELLDKAFRKARDTRIYDRNTFYRNKKTIIARTDTFAANIISALEKYVKEFPSIEKLPLFYQELIDIKIDVNKLRKSLGAIDWARKNCNNIYLKQKKSLSKKHFSLRRIFLIFLLIFIIENFQLLESFLIF